MDLDTDIDVETCHISDNGRPHRYPGLQIFFFFRGSEKKRIASIIVDMIEATWPF